MKQFHFAHIKDSASNTWRPGHARVIESAAPDLEKQGGALYGAWAGLFGVSSNEFYMVTLWDEDSRPEDKVAAALAKIHLDVVREVNLVATVRPTEPAPPGKEGLYVFRWFHVLNKDVDEIARMSNKAWESFEGGFDTEIQGLFAERDREAKEGKMLLLTWYKNLDTWERSRKPSAEARDIFVRRHQMTIETNAFATRLIKQ